MQTGDAGDLTTRLRAAQAVDLASPGVAEATWLCRSKEQVEVAVVHVELHLEKRRLPYRSAPRDRRRVVPNTVRRVRRLHSGRDRHRLAGVAEGQVARIQEPSSSSNISTWSWLGEDGFHACSMCCSAG